MCACADAWVRAVGTGKEDFVYSTEYSMRPCSFSGGGLQIVPMYSRYLPTVDLPRCLAGRSG